MPGDLSVAKALAENLYKARANIVGVPFCTVASRFAAGGIPHSYCLVRLYLMKQL